MKTGFVVSLAAALALMMSVPTGGAEAVGIGKQCGRLSRHSVRRRAVLPEKAGAMQRHRYVRHLHQGSEDLQQDFPSGLRLRRQDLRQRLRAPNGHGFQAKRREMRLLGTIRQADAHAG